MSDKIYGYIKWRKEKGKYSVFNAFITYAWGETLEEIQSALKPGIYG